MTHPRPRPTLTAAQHAEARRRDARMQRRVPLEIPTPADFMPGDCPGHPGTPGTWRRFKLRGRIVGVRLCAACRAEQDALGVE